MSVVSFGRSITGDLETGIGFPTVWEYERVIHLGIRQAEVFGEQGCRYFAPVPFQRAERGLMVEDEALVKLIIHILYKMTKALGYTGKTGFHLAGERGGEFAQDDNHVVVKLLQIVDIPAERFTKRLRQSGRIRRPDGQAEGPVL